MSNPQKWAAGAAGARDASPRYVFLSFFSYSINDYTSGTKCEPQPQPAPVATPATSVLAAAMRSRPVSRAPG